MDQANIRTNRRRNALTAASGRTILIMLLIAALLGLAVTRYFMQRQSSFASAVQADRYQAVFLTNGQVYFGKINAITGNGYKLSDIYYLQVQQSVQPDTNKNQAQNQNQNQPQSLSLAKLGNELHGPENAMYIESKQVLFWENLKDDSQVVKAIKNPAQKQ